MDNKPRLGVVAVVPFWSQSDNLNADSNYAYLRIVLPEMVRQTEDTIFLLFFPDPKHGSDKWVYTPDGLQGDRIRFIPWPYDTQMITSVTGFDPSRFKILENQYGAVIYWLHQVESGNSIKGGYSNSYNDAARPCLIAQHHYIIHRSLPYPYETQFPRQWAQIGGSLSADLVVYNSDYCHKLAAEAFGEYLNHATLTQLERKSRTLQFGLLRGDEPQAGLATDQPPVFIYNHRFEFYKRPDLTFDILAKLRQNHKFEVWATQVHGQKTGGQRNFQIDKSVFAPSRSDYLANIAVPGINTLNSVHETFCISALDSMAIGHLIVAPRALTFPELLPEDYPYLFNSTGEQYEMLERILSTWPQEYNRWTKQISAHAREHFGVQGYVARYLELMVEAEKPYNENTPKPASLSAMQKVWDEMKPGKPYPLIEIRNQISIALYGVIGAKQSFPTRRVMRDTIRFRSDISVLWHGGTVCLIKKN